MLDIISMLIRYAAAAAVRFACEREAKSYAHVIGVACSYAATIRSRCRSARCRYATSAFHMPQITRFRHAIDAATILLLARYAMLMMLFARCCCLLMMLLLRCLCFRCRCCSPYDAMNAAATPPLI